MTIDSIDSIQQIGATAGLVWRRLQDEGPITMARLITEIAAPRDLVMQAIGWLAREDKIWIEVRSRSKIVYLRREGVSSTMPDEN